MQFQKKKIVFSVTEWELVLSLQIARKKKEKPNDSPKCSISNEMNDLNFPINIKQFDQW